MSKQYSIKEVCAELDLSPVWVRRALLQGKLAGHKVEIATNTFKWLIDEEELAKWRKNTKSAGARDDGRNKFNIYATPAEYKKLVKLLSENELSLPLRRANKPRS